MKFFKNILPSSLFGRSLLILITPLLLVQIVTTFMFFDRHWDKMMQRLAFGVAGEIAFLSELVEGDASAASLESLTNHALQNNDISLAYIPDGKLNHISTPDNTKNAVGKTLLREIEKQVSRPADIRVESDEKWVEVNVQLKDGVLSALVPERRLYSSTGYVVLLWMIGTSVIMLAIAVLFMRNQIRPIHRLAIAAERIGKGRDVPFFKEEGAREVRMASRAFMEMRARIDRQIAQRTDMLAGVSHDLRTPLTRMKLQVSMMQDGKDKDDMLSDLADMQRMIDAYLDFARGQGREMPVRVDLRPMLERLIESASRDGKPIHINGDEDVGLMLRPVAIERCFANLIGNAVKYAPEVWINIERGEEAVSIEIDDNGPGVAMALRDDVFKPFFRGDQSRNTKTGGVGLGLPIAQDIIHAHGGEIFLSDSPKGGLRVSVILPV